MLIFSPFRSFIVFYIVHVHHLDGFCFSGSVQVQDAVIIIFLKVIIMIDSVGQRHRECRTK